MNKENSVVAKYVLSSFVKAELLSYVVSRLLRNKRRGRSSRSLSVPAGVPAAEPAAAGGAGHRDGRGADLHAEGGAGQAAGGAGRHQGPAEGDQQPADSAAGQTILHSFHLKTEMEKQPEILKRKHAAIKRTNHSSGLVL